MCTNREGTMRDIFRLIVVVVHTPHTRSPSMSLFPIPPSSSTHTTQRGNITRFVQFRLTSRETLIEGLLVCDNKEGNPNGKLRELYSCIQYVLRRRGTEVWLSVASRPHVKIPLTGTHSLCIWPLPRGVLLDLQPFVLSLSVRARAFDLCSVQRTSCCGCF